MSLSNSAMDVAVNRRRGEPLGSHEYEPTPDDARKLKAADIVFTSGLGWEGWFARLTKASGYTGSPVIASIGIKTRRMEEDGKTVTDPHAWNSIPNAEVYVGNVERALAKADPADAAAFQRNAKVYGAKLEELDTNAHARLVKQIGDATGAQPGGELYVEALSPPNGPASTYAEMFKYNVDKRVAGMKGLPKT